MPRRKAPAHLDGISGAELRRREEPDRAGPRTAAPIAARSVEPDLERRQREDAAGLPSGTTLCALCGADVIWFLSDRPSDRPRNRDGSDHHSSCEPRRAPMTDGYGPGLSLEQRDGLPVSLHADAKPGDASPPRARAQTAPAREAAPLITVGAGPKDARTDPTTGLRYYRWDQLELPSVTTIRRMAGIPHGLHQWAIGQVVTHVLGNAPELARRIEAAKLVDQHHGAGTPLGWASVRQLLAHELRAAATSERDRAAALGTAVHDAAATGRTIAEVDAALRPRLAQYRHWLEVSGAEILATEFQVWSPSVGYAGTADLLVRLRDGTIWLIDLKTGKGVYGEYALQLMAYLMADFSGTSGVIDIPTTQYLHAASGMAVLHLADDHWEFIGLRPDPETWVAFRGLLKFATWMAGHPDAASITLASRKGSAPADQAA